MFQGEDQNKGPHTMKTGAWDARGPHLPTSGQPVSTQNQSDLRLESPQQGYHVARSQPSPDTPPAPSQDPGSNATSTRTAVHCSQPLPAGVRSLDSAPGVGFIWLICVGFPSTGLEFPPLESSGRCQTHVSGNPKSSGKFPSVIFS